MTRSNAIVFDLDDTLYPEREYVLSGFRAVARWAEERIGLPVESGYVDLLRLFEHGVRGNTFNRWAEERDFSSEDLVPTMIRVYRDHDPEIAPFPGALALLEQLRGRYLLGLVSDGYLAVQQKKLAALKISHLLDAVVFSDEWGHEAWKPSLFPFKAVLQRLGVPAERATYVGDNCVKDFLGARQIGMRSIGVRYPGALYAGAEPSSPDHAPDAEISDLQDLDAALANLRYRV